MDIQNEERRQSAVSGIATLPILRKKMSPMVQLLNPILSFCELCTFLFGGLTQNLWTWFADEVPNHNYSFGKANFALTIVKW